MNTSCENFGSNSSNHNSTEEENMTSYVTIFTILLGFPTNFYVIWLIVTGKGNGLVAEFFSLNLAISETIICVNCVFYLLKQTFEILWIATDFLDGFAFTVRPLFQCLICVERYLAVVHPVTFLKYKPLRYRLMCSVCVFVVGLISCGINIATVSLITLYYALILVQFFLFYFFQLFCCVAVLRALKQSGPGERTRDKEENRMKRRAFYLILITNVTLTILYAPYIIFMVPYSEQPNDTFDTVCYASFMLTSLVQPIAFFYRVGKLPLMKCQ